MSMSILKLADQLRTEADAYAYLERLRWNGQPVCPHCGSVRKQFTVLVGTIFHDQACSASGS